MEVLKCMMEVHTIGFTFMYITTTSIQVTLNGYQCLGRILDIIGRDPSVSNSNQLHVDIF